MSLRFLLDTNILSEPVRPSPDSGVMEKVERFSVELSTAAPVWNELLYGCYRLPPSARRRTLETYLMDVLEPTLPVLPYDHRAARWHAAERARLGKEGKTPAFVDGQVAAIARVRDLVLVTRNVSDYAHFEGLVVENWAQKKR